MMIELMSGFFWGGVHIGEQFFQISNYSSAWLQVQTMSIGDWPAMLMVLNTPLMYSLALFWRVHTWNCSNLHCHRCHKFGLHKIVWLRPSCWLAERAMLGWWESQHVGRKMILKHYLGTWDQSKEYHYEENGSPWLGWLTTSSCEGFSFSLPDTGEQSLDPVCVWHFWTRPWLLRPSY